MTTTSEERIYTKRMVSKIVVSGISIHFLILIGNWLKIPNKVSDLLNT